MSFDAPAFALLVLLALPVWFLARRSRAPLGRGQIAVVATLQILAIVAAALALARPSRDGTGAVHRVVVWAGDDEPRASDQLAELRAQGYGDPFVVVRAGATPRLGLPGDTTLPTAPGTPDLDAALALAAAQVPHGARAEITLFSDGRHDGAPLRLRLDQLAARGLAVALRTLPRTQPDTPTLRSLSHPPRVAAGEPFRVHATIRAGAPQPARLELRAAGDGSEPPLIGSAELQLRAGEHVYPLDATSQGRGAVALQAKLTLAGASDPARHVARSAVLVDAPLRVLHLAADASRAQALRAAVAPFGIATVSHDPSQPLDLATFAAHAAVLVDDLPASAWPAASQQALRDAVRTQGTGVVLAGTHHNLGPGGYAASPLADLLPVRMPQREERRDPSVSLVLIVDTSGSMGGGRLELAKEVARLAIQKLQPHDKCGLIEFHGSKRWAAPLQPATNTIEITRALNRLQVGGGTIIYDALEESHYALLSAQTRFQHVLVLTDGGVESGPFEALTRRMATSGQTVSTVLIGPQANSPFLQNLAQWGRGRFYACPDKFQMPDLQFREPQSALLPAVQERAVPLVRSADAEVTAAFADDRLPPSGGIVEASVRPGAEVLLRGGQSSRGGAGEPWLIGWDHAAGRALVLAGELLGPRSGELRADPAWSAFLADLLRSAASGATAREPRLSLAVQEAGVRVRVDLPPGAQLPAAPVVSFVGGAATALAPLVLQGQGTQWLGFLPFAGEAPTALEVRSGDAILAQGAAMPPLSRAARCADASADLALLASLTPRTRPQRDDLTAMFVITALVAFLLGLLLRRLPFDAAGSRRGNAAAAALLLACVLLPDTARAQQPASVPPSDEAAIRAALDAQLRQTGDLAPLATQWQSASPLHRYWLARLSGDLATASKLLEDPALAALRDTRVQLLDVLGRPKDALAALGALPADAPPIERGHWLLRRAWLKLAAGDRTGTAQDLEAAVAAAALPAFTQQAGVLAAAFGFFDLALAWHQVGSEPSRDSLQAALRRGLWQQRKGDLAAAAREFALAHARAPLQRDKTFALAMLAAAHRQAGTLGALADGWLARSDGQGAPLDQQELIALGETLRELGRAKDGLAVLAKLPQAQREALGELPLALAVEAGEPEAAIAQLRAQVAADPQDFTARSSLALLLADLQRDRDAEQTLRDGLAGARPRALRALAGAASELGFDDVVAAVSQALASSGEEGAAIDAALLEIGHARRRGREQDALAILQRAGTQATRPADQLKLAEQFESLGKLAEATALYEAIWAQTRTEDVGMRLAWLLSDAKAGAERARAQAIYKELWTRAGSASRRVQAEDAVLDLAAREGTLADLALELEAQLDDPNTPNRPAVRDALVKIYTRARDTTGAGEILRRWQRDEPQHRVAALQQLARVHAAAEEFRNHERALQQLIELDPEGELDYRQQLAMSALERGKPQDARKHIQGLLGKPGEPDMVAIEFSAGIYALAAMHEESVKLYRRALALHPERVETWLLLGNALRSAGQRDAAIGTFQELLLRPLPDDLFVVAVDGLLNMEAPAPVIAAAARLVRLRLAARPEAVFLHRLLQDLLEAQQDDQARLLALEDTVMAAGEQRTNFVRELMQEAAAKRDWRAYATHGRTLLLLGDEVPPAVYLSLGEALLQTGDLDAAARAFARARLGTDFAATEARTAELYEEAGRLAEAERIRVRLLRRAPQDPQAILHVARLGERQGATARALPHWRNAAMLSLDSELAKPRGGARAPTLRMATRERTTDGPFAEAFAGALRCAQSSDDLAPLRDALLAAARGKSGDARLAALDHLQHLALAFAEPALRSAVRELEATLAASDDARAKQAVRQARLARGDLAGAAELAADDSADSDRLRLLLLQGDAAALRAAAARSKPALLPDLGRALLLAGRASEAQALLELTPAEPATAAARASLRSVLGLAAETVDEPAKKQAALQQALARSGPLLTRINQVMAALRDLPELPASERQLHVRTLASAVLTAKDATAADRLIGQARADLDEENLNGLVTLLFTDLPRPTMLSLRASHTRGLPTERALELIRGALRKCSEEDRTTQLVMMVSRSDLDTAVSLALLGDLDPRRLTDVNKTLLANSIERSRPAPELLAALAERLASALPNEPVTLWLGARSQPDRAARRDAALRALPQLAGRKSGARADPSLERLVEMIEPADARALVAQLPPDAALPLRVALYGAAGDKLAAAQTLTTAFERKPDETPLLYQAATLYESLGQPEQAAALYRRARAQSSTFYPFQAMQLARLELAAGKPLQALEALRAAKDPTAMNFRLWMRALAEVSDPAVRRAGLAQVLQQRAARGSGAAGIASGALLVSRALNLSGNAGDRLAAVLAPPRLPRLAPQSLADADDAASDFDLLAFLPEGEDAARAYLRSLDASARQADLGVYRGMLGAAARQGRAQAHIDAAVAALREAPYDAEAGRVLLAAAQLGLSVPQPALAQVLATLASEGRLSTNTALTLLGLAEPAGRPELATHVLRTLVSERSRMGDAQLRSYLPGLFALACREHPAAALALLEGELEREAAIDLAAALLVHHPEPATAARTTLAAAARAAAAGAGAPGVRQGDAVLPEFGAQLMLGEVAAAFTVLESAGFWMNVRMLPKERLAAAVPPLPRWSKPEAASDVATRLLAQLRDGDDDRRGALARMAALLAARLHDAGQTEAAAALRAQLRDATQGLAWDPAAWL